MKTKAHLAVLAAMAAAFAGLASLPARAESLGTPATFDCSVTTNLAQTIVCASPELSDLDRKFDAAATKAGKKAAAARKSLARSRDACTSIACISKAYATATAALSGTPQPAEKKPKAETAAATDASTDDNMARENTPEPTPAPKADDKTRQQLEEAQKALEAAKAAQADAESRLAALQSDLEGAKAKAVQDANAKLAIVAGRWTKFLTRLIALQGDGYGVVTIESGSEGLCYATGSEGRSYQNLVGIGQPKDLRGEFLAALITAMPDQFGKMGEPVKVENVAVLTAQASRTCAAVFGRASDLRAVMTALDKSSTAYALMPLWFDAAEFQDYASKAESTAANGG